MGLFRFLLGAAVGATAAIVTGGASVVVGAAVGGAVTEFAGSVSDDEIATKNRREGYAQGVNDGTRAGNQAAAKKMATLLEKEDEVKTAIFALAISVANLDEKLCGYDKEAIYAYLGKLDSQVVSKKLQKEYNRIIERKPDFDTVKREYLDKIPSIDLKELDEVVKEIIFDKEDKPTIKEKEFYKKQWVPYVKKTSKTTSETSKKKKVVPRKVSQSKTSLKKSVKPKFSQKKDNAGIKRIYEVAKESGIKSSAILKILSDHNIKKTNFSKVDDKDMKILHSAFRKGC